MGLLGYPLLDLNIFEYFLNSRFCRKKQLLLLDLIWVWGMFRVKRQEWKWIPVNGSDSKWKERKENARINKKSPQKVVKLLSSLFCYWSLWGGSWLYWLPLMAPLHYSTSTCLMHKREDKWILFGMSRGDIPTAMLGYWSTIEPSGHQTIPKKLMVWTGRQTSNRIKAKGGLSQF